jgi:hypothetical protein
MRRIAILAALAVACGTTSSNPDGGSTPNRFTVGGSISGPATGLVITTDPQPNVVTVTSGETSYTFPNELQSGTAYNVTVTTQPSGATCTIANPQGVVETANVTNVNVSCTASANNTCAAPPCYTITVASTTAGGAGLVVADHGQPNTTLGSNGQAIFPNSVSNGTAYAVTIVSQPPPGNSGDATCTVNTTGTNSGTGTVNGSNVLVDVVCAISLP